MADRLTKDYGPLEHWRRIRFLLGEQLAIDEFQAVIEKKIWWS